MPKVDDTIHPARSGRGAGAPRRAFLLCACAAAAASMASADIPSDYKGTPYGGAPRSIPGRIDFEHYDLGGPGVAWKHDNKAGAAGSTAGGREDDGEAQHPSFYTTNSHAGEVDVLLPGNTLYPSEENPKSVYIGASHNTDWANVTVDVKEAGEYWLSAHFASVENQIRFHVKFNNEKKIPTVTLPGTGGYHNWRHFRNFAKVQLEAGLQVMQFYLEFQHLNWDYVSFSRDSAATGLGGSRGILASGPEPLLGARWMGANRLSFRVEEGGPYRIRVLDPQGRLTAPAAKLTLEPGRRTLAWRGGAASGALLILEDLRRGKVESGRISPVR